MHFPYSFNFFGLHLHPHPTLEVVAYSGGFQLYLLLRRKWPRPAASVPFEQNAWIIVGAVFGALIGSKLLAWAESPVHYWALRGQPEGWIGGKTIVGGLLGGWAGVEIAKKWLGIAHRTGDVYVFPLILGIAVGRVGCFLTGLSDHTHGIRTSVPWAVDFGDGPRHPTQLYEVTFLLVLAAALLLRMRRPWADGELFRLFLMAYLAFRFAVDFIKPRFTGYGGVSAIQWGCVGGVVVCAASLVRIRGCRPAAGGPLDDSPATALPGGSA
jgi:prolipoprotein diacylglyceryltransferase